MSEHDCHWRRMQAQHQARKDEDALARPVVAERIRALEAALAEERERAHGLFLTGGQALEDLAATRSERDALRRKMEEVQSLVHDAEEMGSSLALALTHIGDTAEDALRDLNDGGSDASQGR